MAAPETRKLTAKFFKDDVVTLKSKPNESAMVLRCWHDGLEDNIPIPESDDPLDRQLAKGEYGVRYYTGYKRAIVKEDELVLQDRAFHPGDVVKVHLTDVQSGVVVGIEGEVRLRHVTSGQVVDWVPVQEVESALDVMPGEYVIKDNWIGTVIEVFEDNILYENRTGRVTRMAEKGLHLEIGKKASEIYDARSGFSEAELDQMAIQVKPTVVVVAWLALNQSLPPSEMNVARPKLFWTAPELDQLQRFVSPHDYFCRPNERVRFASPELAQKYGMKSVPFYDIEISVMAVLESRMRAKVLWQDGTVSEHTSTSLVPFANIDEYDCWPGDYVMWKGDEGIRGAVVQKVSPSERIVEVMFMDDKTIATVSALEVDPQGPPPSIYGVRQGDMVLINRTDNGEVPPAVPRLGEIEPRLREPADGKFDWFTEMGKLGRELSLRTDLGPCKLGRASVEWVGEVVSNRLDGQVEILLPSGRLIVEPLQRLSLLIEDELLMGEWPEEGLGSDVDMSDGQWSEASWETVEEDWAASDDEAPPPLIDLAGADHDGDIAMEDLAEPELTMPGALAPLESAPNSSAPTPRPSSSTAISPPPPPEPEQPPEDDPNWERFIVSETAPPDHHFLSREPGQTGKAFLSRLQKEYKVLQSSLPHTILVRAYEDRSDLLRSLILGPENTPYEDAAFVIDWYLEPTFPQTPPQAHFHSWTNGNGRVNPNLYEEGKVCLSILNTWQGDRTESWSAARSSLLQALVSIQGLVLVKEPWYCEPAYEKLRGTEEATVSSRMYSEKAYVLSRGFVRYILEYPPIGLEDEVRWQYYDRGTLSKVIRDAESLIASSTAGAETSDDKSDRAVPRLTQGGILPLRRTLTKLHALLGSHVPTQSS